MYAAQATEVLHAPSRALETFGTTCVNYHLLAELEDNPGKIRIRKSGSAGGHNGLKSIITFCTDKFPRIRIGVGAKPTPEYDLADWVTGKFSAEDKKAIEARFADIEKVIPLILAGDFDKAMCWCNG